MAAASLPTTPAVKSTAKTALKFADKLSTKVDIIKYLANWGVAAILVGYIFVIELPALRKENVAREAATALREQDRYKEFREDRKAGLAHAEHAVTEIGGKLSALRDAILEQTSTIIRVQEVTHKNQEKTLKVQEQIVEDMNKNSR